MIQVVDDVVTNKLRRSHGCEDGAGTAVALVLRAACAMPPKVVLVRMIARRTKMVDNTRTYAEVELEKIEKLRSGRVDVGKSSKSRISRQRV